MSVRVVSHAAPSVQQTVLRVTTVSSRPISPNCNHSCPVHQNREVLRRHQEVAQLPFALYASAGSGKGYVANPPVLPASDTSFTYGEGFVS
eukprot:1966882-Amphidinium_carterae.5